MVWFRKNKIFTYLLGEKGASFIEVILVAAILSVMILITTPQWQSLSDEINLKDAVQLVEAKIKFAKNQSLAALNDNNYGIHFDANAVTLFTGSTYSAIDPANVVYNLPDGVEIYNISLGGGSDLVFSRLTGVSASSGTFGMRIANRPAKNKLVYVNNQGQVSTKPFETSSAVAILESPVQGFNARHLHFDLFGWSIQSSSTSSLVLKKGDGTVVQTINAAPYFTSGIFDWQGSVTIDGVAQRLRVHTLDAGGGTVCVMRDRTENSKSLIVSFVDNSVAKGIVTYTENVDGTVTVTSNAIYVSSTNAQ